MLGFNKIFILFNQLKHAAVSILKDLSEDSEVRIKAYLALVECPCQKVADAVKSVLENEKVNQGIIFYCFDNIALSFFIYFFC